MAEIVKHIDYSGMRAGAEYEQTLAAEVDGHIAFVNGISEGGTMSILFAASYPERTAALILYCTYARCYRSPDHPAGDAPENFDAAIEHIRTRWASRERGGRRLGGSLALLERRSPSDPRALTRPSPDRRALHHLNAQLAPALVSRLNGNWIVLGDVKIVENEPPVFWVMNDWTDCLA